MKVTRMAVLTAGTALLMLSACGTDRDAAETSAVAGSEMATQDAPATETADRDWMPVAIVLPEPHTVLADADIGMRTHYLQIVVQDDPTPMFSQWSEALVAAGYDVRDVTADGILLFSGLDVDTGQIAVMELPEDEGFRIQVDVTRSQ